MEVEKHGYDRTWVACLRLVVFLWVASQERPGSTLLESWLWVVYTKKILNVIVQEFYQA